MKSKVMHKFAIIDQKRGTIPLRDTNTMEQTEREKYNE